MLLSVRAFSSTLLLKYAWWLDRWLDESRWCAQPPQISTLSERAYDFEPRTLHHIKEPSTAVFARSTAIETLFQFLLFTDHLSGKKRGLEGFGVCTLCVLFAEYLHCTQSFFLSLIRDISGNEIKIFHHIGLSGVGVNVCCHSDGAMAHEVLSCSDVNSSSLKVGAVCMPQTV